MAVSHLSAESTLVDKETSQTQLIWQRFSKHHLALTGLGILLLLALFAFVGPALTPYDPEQQFVAAPNGVPTQKNLLGTDELGRDVMTRLMWAGRISIVLSIVVTVGSILIGTVSGAVAGYFGGWVDVIIMRLVDFMLTLPVLPILLLLSAMSLRGGLLLTIPEFITQFFGWIWGMSAERAESVLVLGIFLIVFGWMSSARLVRGQVLSLRNMDYTEASRALGASDWRIIRNHMVPNAMAPIIVAATFGFGGVIVTEAALSFIGFGVQQPSASWGNMLNGVRDFMLVQPWRAFIPGLAIFLATVSFNFVGDALRDALDPRLKL